MIGHESGEVNIRIERDAGKRIHLLNLNRRFRSGSDACDGDDIGGADSQAGLPEEDGVDQPEVLTVSVSGKQTAHQDDGSINYYETGWKKRRIQIAGLTAWPCRARVQGAALSDGAGFG